MTKLGALPETKSLLKTKKYLLFWIASLLSNIGTWMQQVAQPWVMLAVSQSSFLVGLDSFAMNAPAWVLTLWGGALADRLDRKKIILLFQSIQFFAILVMLVLLVMGILKPWIIIVTSLVVGITDALSVPSFQTIVPSMVTAKEIPQAVSLNAIQFNLSRTLGPAIAGVMMVQFGAVACFGVNAFSYIPFFLSIFWIFPAKGIKTNLQDENLLKPSMKKTVQEVLKQYDLRTQLVSTFVTTLFCSPLVTFSPVLIKEVFDGEIKKFGLVSTAFGLGGLIGALVAYSSASKFKEKSPSLFGIALGAVVIGTALSKSVNALVGLMILAGALLTLANNTANSNLQLRATNQVRGKYSSLFQLAFRGGLSLGALISGVLISQWGIVHALFIDGGCAMFFQCLLLFLGAKRNAKIIDF